MSKDSRLVYSTDKGRIKPTTETIATDDGDGIVRIFRESRKGSGVSVIKGLPPTADIKAIAKQLKQKLGVGGSIKNGSIEIQTDQREKIKSLLDRQGFTVKIAGG